MCTAGSAPPRIRSADLQYSTAFRSNMPAASGEQKRRKYQDDSKNVSNVSVSRCAAPPHFGQATCFQVGCRSSGLPGASKVTRSEEHTSELQSLMRISYAVFCLKKKKKNKRRSPTLTIVSKEIRRKTDI